MSSWNKPLTKLIGILCGSTLFLGCATSQWLGGNVDKSDSLYEKVLLTYRTDSDRLNAGSSTAAVVPTSYQPNWTRPLPSCAIGTIDIRYPHPAGKPNVGQVKVVFRAAGVDSAVVSRSVWKKFHGLWNEEAEQSDENNVLEVWTMDLPKYQLDTIVGKLKKTQFFRKKVRTLNSNVFLAAQIDDGIRVGKNYKAIPELDALITRVHREGRLVYAPRPAGVPGPPTGFSHPVPGHSSPGQHITRLPAPMSH